jgi:hypothetical protein
VGRSGAAGYLFALFGLLSANPPAAARPEAKKLRLRLQICDAAIAVYFEPCLSVVISLT